MLLLACLAVFFTAAVPGSIEQDQSLAIFGFDPYTPRLHWRYAGLCVASLCLIVALTRQIGALRRAPAFRVAAAGRLLYAMGIGLCLGVTLLMQRGFVDRPVFLDVLLYSEACMFPNVVWYPLLVASTACLANGRPRRHAAGRAAWGIASLAAVASVAWLVVVAIDWSQVVALVHLAIDGIEKSQPLAMQRRDSFLNHAAEGYQVYYRSLRALAGLAVLVVAVITSQLRREPWLRWAAAVFAAGVACGLARFAWWFHAFELERINPDMDSTGLNIFRFPVGVAAMGATAVVALWLAARLARPTPTPGTVDSLPSLRSAECVVASVTLVLVGLASLGESFAVAFYWTSFPILAPGRARSNVCWIRPAICSASRERCSPWLC